MSGLHGLMPNADQNSGIGPNVDKFGLRGISDQCHDFDQG